jgi:hypothetical protein
MSPPLSGLDHLGVDNGVLLMIILSALEGGFNFLLWSCNNTCQN